MRYKTDLSKLTVQHAKEHVAYDVIDTQEFENNWPRVIATELHEEDAKRIVNSLNTKFDEKGGVTVDFMDRSAKAAIRALRGLEQTAIMLEKYAPEIFPEVNEQGQKHFGRVMMEAAAEEIRNAWSAAINEISPSKVAG